MILVTGAAGFIGSKTVKLLTNSGEIVIGLDSLNSYYPAEIKKYRLKEIENRKFTFIKGDVSDTKLVKNVFSTYSIKSVIHLAAMAGVRNSIENPEEYLQTNITGTLTLLNEMKTYGVNKLVLASTSSLYAGQNIPFTEKQPTDRPLSPYAASKKAAEALAYTYHHLYGIDVSILRYFTVYGPCGRPDMSPFLFVHSIINGFPLPLYGDGTQRRDFTYIDDVARANIQALQPVGYEIVNIGCGIKPVSINKMIKIIEEETEQKAIIEHLPRNKADMDETLADTSKANRVLSWEPEMSFKDGIKSTVNWHKENNEWLLKALERVARK